LEIAPKTRKYLMSMSLILLWKANSSAVISGSKLTVLAVSVTYPDNSD